MVEIYWTEEAKFWLKDIYDYISQDNPTIAKRVINDIYKKVQILSSFPQIGYLYENEENKTIRILLYGHYRIAYIIKENQQIDILGVFHGALAIHRYLK